MKKAILTIAVSVTLSVFGSAFILAPSTGNIGGLIHNVNETFGSGITVVGDGSFSSTATASLVFDSGAGKGTCFAMENTAGTTEYVRIVGTTLTVSTASCR